VLKGTSKQAFSRVRLKELLVSDRTRVIPDSEGPRSDDEFELSAVLAYLADIQQKSTRTVMNAMSDEFGLTAELRPQMIPSGRAKLWDNRV
jgi:hypothetical protein